MMDPSAAANTFQDAFMSLLSTNGWDYSRAQMAGTIVVLQIRIFQSTGSYIDKQQSLEILLKAS